MSPMSPTLGSIRRPHFPAIPLMLAMQISITIISSR
jgi:hypothetical protein